MGRGGGEQWPRGRWGPTTLPGRPKVGGRFRLRDLEGRLNSAFLGLFSTSCGPSFSGHGYPTQGAANTSCPRSGRFRLYELRVSRTFLDQLRPQLFRPWIPNSARHRRWTPMIHRGRARRTISAGNWFGQWSPGPPSSATAVLPAPDRWRVTWRPPLSRMAGPGDPGRTSPRPSARHLEPSGRPNGGVGRPLPEPAQ